MKKINQDNKSIILMENIGIASNSKIKNISKCDNDNIVFL